LIQIFLNKSFKKGEDMKIVMLSLMFVFMFVCIIFAVDSTVTIDTVVKNVANVVGAIKGFKMSDVALIILLSAIISLIVSLMKFKPVAAYLDTEKMKGLKPYIALILGIIGGVVNNLTSGQDILTGVILGIVAGLGSVGIHESLKTLQGKNK
jgi:hypothetical protein